jgi:hypothetical protein
LSGIEMINTGAKELENEISEGVISTKTEEGEPEKVEIIYVFYSIIANKNPEL